MEAEMGTIVIPLTRGYEALIDEEDYDLVKNYRWRCDGLGTKRNPFVAVTGKFSVRMYDMHRLIMGNPKYPVRHKDGNTLNNTRENLVRRSNYSPSNLTTSLDLAYFAGIVDGEGCITASGRLHPFVSLSVVNTYFPVIEDFKKFFGGATNSRKPRSPKHRMTLGWIIGGIGAAEVLKLLLPYLRIKADQAILAIELCNFQDDKSMEGLQKRREMAQKLRDLNHREYDSPSKGIIEY
jgi:hypothetical protein